MKEHFRGTPDEFMSCEFALKAKVSSMKGCCNCCSHFENAVKITFVLHSPVQQL